jgi:predicted PurR-regulated permease PerM
MAKAPQNNYRLPWEAHVIFWTLSTLAFAGLVWLFSDILMPFVLGIVIAYLLAPTVNFLEKKTNLPRWSLCALILALFILVFTAIIVLIAPPLYQQISVFADNAPAYFDHLMNIASPYMTQLESYFESADQQSLQDTLKDSFSTILSTGSGMLGKALTAGQALLSTISLLVLTPLVAFFMMNEWPRIQKWIDDLIPKHAYETVTSLLKDIDSKLSGFIRGQLLVAVVLGISYAVALSLAGLQYGFLVGLVAGALSIIPLFGSTVGLLTSVIIAWFQSGEISYVGIIAAIFIAGQLLEGNVITPKLLGKSVGLHPLWILFALMAGGSLFGILGMLLAVPVAATVGVLAHFGIRQYKKSAFYTQAHKKNNKKKTQKSNKKASI